MKKSTLITTIAMIVVVVVALSTATYAWFTAGTTTTAVAHMQTTASSDFTLTVVTGTTDTATWSGGQTGTGLALTNGSGLAAPTQAIATTVSYSTSESSITNPASFYEASVSGTNKGKITVQATPKGIDAMRLTNVRDANKNVYLYVVVAVNGETTNSLYAAEATSFYVTSATAANSDAIADTWTNGYGIATGDPTTVDNEMTYSEEITDGVLSTTVISTGVANNSKTARPTYSGLASNFALANNEKAELGIGENQYVLVYLIELGVLKPSESLVLGVYTWIDGWRADNAAGGASYDVTYAFTSTPQTFVAKAQS